MKKRLIVYEAESNTIISYRGDKKTHFAKVKDAKQSFYDRVAYKNEFGSLNFRDGYTHQFGVVPEFDGEGVDEYIIRSTLIARKHDAIDKLLLVDVQEDGETVAIQFSYGTTVNSKETK